MSYEDARALVEGVVRDGGMIPTSALQSMQLEESVRDFHPERVLAAHVASNAYRSPRKPGEEAPHPSTHRKAGYVCTDTREAVTDELLRDKTTADSATPPIFPQMLTRVPLRTSKYELLPAQRRMVAYMLTAMTSLARTRMDMVYDRECKDHWDPEGTVTPERASVCRESQVHGSFQLLNTGTGTGKSAMSILVTVMMLCCDGIYEASTRLHVQGKRGAQCGFTTGESVLVRVARIETQSAEVQYQMLQELACIWPQLRESIAVDMELEIWAYNIPEELRALVVASERREARFQRALAKALEACRIVRERNEAGMSVHDEKGTWQPWPLPPKPRRIQARLTLPSCANRQIERMMAASPEAGARKAVLWMSGTDQSACWINETWKRQCAVRKPQDAKRLCLADLREDTPPMPLLYIRLLDEGLLRVNTQNGTKPAGAYHTLITQATGKLITEHKVGTHHWLSAVVSSKLHALMSHRGDTMTATEFHEAIQSLMKLNLAMPPLALRREVVLGMLPLLPAGVRVTNVPMAWGRLARSIGGDALITTSLADFVKAMVPKRFVLEFIKDRLEELQQATSTEAQRKALEEIHARMQGYRPNCENADHKGELEDRISGIARLLERLSEDSECLICDDALPSACLVMPCCTGVVCKRCLEKCRQNQGKCPHCRAALISDLRPCDLAVQPPAACLEGVLTLLQLQEACKAAPKPVTATVPLVVSALIAQGCTRLVLFCTDPSKLREQISCINGVRVVFLSEVGARDIHLLHDYKDTDENPAPMMLLASHSSNVSEMTGLDLGMTDGIVTSGAMPYYAQVLGRALRPGDGQPGKVVEWVQLRVQA